VRGGIIVEIDLNISVRFTIYRSTIASGWRGKKPGSRARVQRMLALFVELGLQL